MKNSQVYGKLLANLEAESSEVESAEKLTTAELMRRERAKQETRLEELRKQAQVSRELEEKRLAQERADQERREREVQEAAEKAKRDAEEAAIAEMERKTKKFYTLGRFRRRVETGAHVCHTTPTARERNRTAVLTPTAAMQVSCILATTFPTGTVGCRTGTASFGSAAT